MEKTTGIIAQTQRLTLRTLTENDIDHIFRISIESPLISHLLQNDLFTASLRETCWKEETVPNLLTVLLFLRDGETLVGKVCMQHTNHPIPELGIDILSEFRNQGFGPEAIIAFGNWYSEEHQLEKVKVRISKENHHSMHVFEKLGAILQKSTPYLPPEKLAAIKQQLPDSDLSVLFEDSFREYLLPLPIH